MQVSSKNNTISQQSKGSLVGPNKLWVGNCALVSVPFWKLNPNNDGEPVEELGVIVQQLVRTLEKIDQQVIHNLFSSMFITYHLFKIKFNFIDSSSVI